MKNRIELAKHFNTLGFKKGAEVGVANGYFSEELCKAIPELELCCIDPWHKYKDNQRGGGQEQHDNNFQIAQERLTGYNVKFIKSYSMDAVIEFEDESLDFVYIDGHHDFDYVMEDIINWTKKVRKGGIVAGHDYYHFNNSGVIEAVNAYTQIHKFELQLTQRNNDTYKDNRPPSWWFIKK